MIYIEGSIAAGKTTLGNAIVEMSPEFTFWEEPVEAWRDWGILEAYYKDPQRWAFTMQIAALTTRVAILKKAIGETHGISGTLRSDRLILERSVLTDRRIFAEYSSRRANMSRVEVEIYRAMWTQSAALMLVEPTIIYLRTPAEECLTRIHHRGRPEEQSILLSYLDDLEQLHDEWLRGRDPAKTAVISGDQSVEEEVNALIKWRYNSGV